MSIVFTPIDLPLSVARLSITGMRFRVNGPWRPPPDLPASLQRAVPKRQAEFMAGRLAAAEACQHFGIDAPRMPIGPDRRPIWPRQLTGSISHSGDIAAAAVGLRSDWAGIGIDVEQIDPECKVGIFVPRIATETEIANLSRQFDRIEAATLLFSAKEAIYKAVSSLLTDQIRFREFSCLGLESDRVIFAVSDATSQKLQCPLAVAVHFAVTTEHVHTLYMLASPAAN